MIYKLKNKIVSRILKEDNESAGLSEKIKKPRKPEVEVKGKYLFNDNSEDNSIDEQSESLHINTPLESIKNIKTVIDKQSNSNRTPLKCESGNMENLSKFNTINSKKLPHKGNENNSRQGYSSLLNKNSGQNHGLVYTSMNEVISPQPEITNIIKMDDIERYFKNNDSLTKEYIKRGQENTDKLEKLFTLTKSSKEDVQDEFIIYRKEFSDLDSDKSKRSVKNEEENNEKLYKNIKGLYNEKNDPNFANSNCFKGIDSFAFDSNNINKFLKETNTISFDENKEKPMNSLKVISNSTKSDSNPIKFVAEKDRKPEMHLEEPSNLSESKQKNLISIGESSDHFKNQFLNDFGDTSSIHRNFHFSNRELKPKETLSEDEEILYRLENRILKNDIDPHLSSNGFNKKTELILDQNLNLFQEEHPVSLNVKKRNETHYNTNINHSDPTMKVKNMSKLNKVTHQLHAKTHIKNSKSIHIVKPNKSKTRNKSPNLIKKKQISFSPKDKKICEADRINTFNRLIEDANRRIEANNEFERIKSELNINYSKNINKRYNTNDWDDIYNNRFKQFIQQKNTKIENMIEEKKEKQEEREKEYLDEIERRRKKAPSILIEQNANRMYLEAEKRKIKIEKKIQKQDENINLILTTNKSPQNSVFRKVVNPVPRVLSPKSKYIITENNPLRKENELKINKSKSISQQNEDNFKSEKITNFKKSIVVQESKFDKIKLSKALNTINPVSFSKSLNKSGLHVEKKPVIPTNEVHNNFNTTEIYSNNNHELFNRYSNAPKIRTNDLKSIKASANLKTKKNIFIPESMIDKYIDTILKNKDV